MGGFKDGLEHLPLHERVALRAKKVAEMAAELTGVDAGKSEADQLRDGWREADQQHARDVKLMFWLHAESEWHRERERSSRQAWAEEALRLEVEWERERRVTAAYAEQARTHRCDVSDTQIDADTMTDIYPSRGVKATAHPDTSVPDLYDPDLDLARPQCTVHPENGGA